MYVSLTLKEQFHALNLSGCMQLQCYANILYTKQMLFLSKAQMLHANPALFSSMATRQLHCKPSDIS